MRVLTVFTEVLKTNPTLFSTLIPILHNSAIGVLLPDFVNNLVLLQLKRVAVIVLACKWIVRVPFTVHIVYYYMISQ